MFVVHRQGAGEDFPGRGESAASHPVEPGGGYAGRDGMYNDGFYRTAGKGSGMEVRGRMTESRRKRPGSRLLLGIALVFGTLGAVYAGALLADFALDLLGVASPPVRLGVKAIAMAAALPAGFYLVERAFLARNSTISRKTPGP